MRWERTLLVVSTVALASLAAWALVPPLRQSTTWQNMAVPGPLSSAHAPLGADCGTCHTPVRGVEDATCVGCHANETALVQRQPTAFHADIAGRNNCVACHKEHDGGAGLRNMDHAALARIMGHRPDSVAPMKPTKPEAALDCARCHRTTDPHVQVFGNDCATCHGTSTWSIATFRHPLPSSTDCGQCHLAPLSHYKEHFNMMSKPVAGVKEAEPEQCHLCHQTTSWNDIRGVGIYDHH